MFRPRLVSLVPDLQEAALFRASSSYLQAKGRIEVGRSGEKTDYFWENPAFRPSTVPFCEAAPVVAQ